MANNNFQYFSHLQYGNGKNLVLHTSVFSPVPAQLIYNISDNDNGELKPYLFDVAKIQLYTVSITGVDFKPVYSTGNIFTRTRVQGTIAINGVVTLNVVPSTDFIIHYVYAMGGNEYIIGYIPNDIVSEIEAEFLTAQIAGNVFFDKTETGFFTSDTVQDVFDEIPGVVNEITNNAMKSPEGDIILGYNTHYAGIYKEPIYSGGKMIELNAWNNSGKEIKLYSIVFNYTDDLLTSIVITDEISEKICTKTLSYNIDNEFVSIEIVFT